MEKKRRRFTPEEKVRILRRHFLEDVDKCYVNHNLDDVDGSAAYDREKDNDLCS